MELSEQSRESDGVVRPEEASALGATGGRSPVLLVLAAGMGSRYGGLKQVDPMGPNGETVLDYAVYDAIACGFTRIVFVIRRDIEAAFRTAIGARYEGRIRIDYAFQERGDLPPGFTCPPDRQKPWGTGQAVYAARQVIDGPFAVINADDFYGRTAYRTLADFFAQAQGTSARMAMVAFALEQTLSASGSVNRGICLTQGDFLESVVEFHDIKRNEHGTITGTDPQGKPQTLAPDTPVSMNFWGFTPDVFAELESAFAEFLGKSLRLPKAEFYLPAFVDEQIRCGNAVCHVLPCRSNWFGVTYPEDKPHVQAQLRQLHADGAYPQQL